MALPNASEAKPTFPTARPPTSSRRRPTIVIPAKAGIQRGGWGCGKTTTHRLPVISVSRYEAGTSKITQ